MMKLCVCVCVCVSKELIRQNSRKSKELCVLYYRIFFFFLSPPITQSEPELLPQPRWLILQCVDEVEPASSRASDSASKTSS